VQVFKMEFVNPHTYDKHILTKIRFVCFHELNQPYNRPISSLSALERHQFLKLFRKYLLEPIEEIDYLFEIISSEMFDSTDQSLNLRNKQDIPVKEGRSIAPPWFALPSYEFGDLKPSVLDIRMAEAYKEFLETSASKALDDLNVNA
jgi:hypothetical protein